MEIVKSLTVKVNLGDYQNASYFCSIKDECEEDDLEAVGEKLRDYCKKQILSDMNATKKFWAEKLKGKERSNVDKILDEEVE